MSDIAMERLKSGWAFKALTPRAKTAFLAALGVPFGDMAQDVFLQNLLESERESWLRLFESEGLTVEGQEKPDPASYTF